MKKKFVRLISAVLSAAMTLTAVPLSAFAEGEAHTHDGEKTVSAGAGIMTQRS